MSMSRDGTTIIFSETFKLLCQYHFFPSKSCCADTLVESFKRRGLRKKLKKPFTSECRQEARQKSKRACAGKYRTVERSCDQDCSQRCDRVFSPKARRLHDKIRKSQVSIRSGMQSICQGMSQESRPMQSIGCVQVRECNWCVGTSMSTEESSNSIGMENLCYICEECCWRAPCTNRGILHCTSCGNDTFRRHVTNQVCVKEIVTSLPREWDAQTVLHCFEIAEGRSENTRK